jgi:RHS repeat-associated protein
MGASSAVSINITGTGFNNSASDNEITFSPPSGIPIVAPASAVVTLDAAKDLRRLTVKVPLGLPVGSVALRVRNKITGEMSEGGSIEIIKIQLAETRSGAPGATNLNVRITGSPNVRFLFEGTRVTFGEGINVNSTTVESPSELVANITLSSSVVSGSRNVGVITATQTALLEGGFTVVEVPPKGPPSSSGILSAVTPMGASSSVSVNITGMGFDPVASNNEVRFLPASGSPVSAVASAVTTLDAIRGIRRLTVKVPAGLSTGTATLRVLNKISGEVIEGKSIEIIEIGLAEVKSAPPGAVNLNIRITGSANTQFVSGGTRVSFGAGITVHSIEVKSSSELIANISLSASALPGPRTVGVITGTQTAVLEGEFEVAEAPAGAPAALSSVVPMGASSFVSVKITGTGFDPDPSNNEVRFQPLAGAPLTASSSAVETLDASKGIRRLTVTVPPGLSTGTASLQVLNKVTGRVSEGKSIEIVEINLPELRSSPPGAEGLNVRIAGSPNARFLSGGSRVTFGAGITINSVTVESPTALVANITLASSAALGSRDVGVITGTQTALLRGGFTVVADSNRPPQFTSSPPLLAQDGQRYLYQATATDPDGDPFTFTMERFPSGMGMTDGLLSWTPTARQIGVHPVVVVVSDAKGGSGEQRYEITVRDLTAPRLELKAPTEVLPGSTVTVTVQVNDNAATESVTFKVEDGPPNRIVLPPFEQAVSIPSVASVGATIRVQATARDPSGNEATAEAIMKIVAQADAEPPTVTLHSPTQTAPGATIHLSAGAQDNVGVALVRFSVGGTVVSEDRISPYEATYAVASDAPVGSELAISAEAVDFGNNTARNGASVTVVEAPDVIPPTATLTAPAEVEEGGILLLSADASDDWGVASVAFYVNDVRIGTDTDAPYQTRFQLPAAVKAGDRLRVAARATDFFGHETPGFGETLVTAALLPGVGVIAGEVYDNATGLPLREAAVELTHLDGEAVAPPAPGAVTDARGRYRIVSRPGIARLRIRKTNYTVTDRIVQVLDGKRSDPFDSRLTPTTGPGTPIASVIGGQVTGMGAQAILTVPANALVSDQVIRLTRVSGQGVIRPLPLGWSPVAVVDIAPSNLAFTAAVSLSIAAPEGLPEAAELDLAWWEGERGVWIAAGKASRSVDGKSLTASLSRSGQYAFLLSDPPPGSPPPPVTGEPLPDLSPTPLPENITAAISPSPRILFAGADLRAEVGLLVTPPSRMASGTPAQLRLDEMFDFTNGAYLDLPSAMQDLLLYLFPSANTPLSLQTSAWVTPSRLIPPHALRLGVIDLGVHLPESPGSRQGSVIGAKGGAVATATGEEIHFSAGATEELLPVELSPLTQSQFRGRLPERFPFLAGLEVDLHGGALTLPAEISVPAPSGLSGSGPILLTQQIEFDGASYFAVVALGRDQEGGLASVTDPRGEGSLLFPGVRSEGRFAFIQSDVPLGFLTGIVSGSDGQPLDGALISVDTYPLVALADRDGRYLIAAPVGPVRLTVTDPKTQDTVSLAMAVDAPEAVATAGLSLSPTPPTVLSVQPADGSQNVPLTTVITLTLSEPVDPAGLTPGSIRLTAGGIDVPGTLSLAPGNSLLAFRPNVLLVSDTTYQVILAAGLKDLTGNPMAAPFQSHFITVDLTPPPPPPAGSLTVTIPEGGSATISGTQGTAEPGGLVLVNNLTSGQLTTLTPNADGSFSGRVTASNSDRLEIRIRDSAGNEIKLPAPAFRNPDGSVVIGAAGGRVEGAGGIFVDIPPGALPNGTVVKIEPVPVSDLAIPPPAEFPAVGVIRLDLGGIIPKEPLDLGFPAPSDATADEQVLVAQIVELPNQKGWTVVDRAQLQDGKFVTASPPFPGITLSGEYSFLRPVEVIGTGANGVLDSLPPASDDRHVRIDPLNESYDQIDPGANGKLDTQLRGDDLIKRNCISYVAAQYRYGVGVVLNVVGSAFIFPSLQGEAQIRITPMPAVCNRELTIQVSDPNTDNVLRRITARAPEESGIIVTVPQLLTDDTVPPVILLSDLPTGAGNQLNDIQILFSEPMDPSSVEANFKVTDASGNPLSGKVALSQKDTLALFRAEVPFRLGEEYTVTLAGATDLAGNDLKATPIKFKPFQPVSLSALRDIPECIQNGCATGVQDQDLIGNTLFVASNDPNSPNRLLAVDVGDPAHPRLLGFHSAFPNLRAVAALPKARFFTSSGDAFEGDLLLVIGGRVDEFGKLEIYDVTACTQPHVLGNCLEEALKGRILLSTPANIPPPQGVPPEPGTPSQLATLNQSGTSVAYVVTVPIGLEAVDVAKAYGNLPRTPATNVAPVGLYRGKFVEVEVLKNLVLAVNALDDSLSVFTAQLGLEREMALPVSAWWLAAGENFVFDIDGDRNLGLEEDADGDAVSAKQELFDLVALSSGPLTQGCAITSPCGELYILDFSDLTDLAHRPDLTAAERIIARIPLPGPASDVQLDAGRKLAYVEVSGRGLAAIDLHFLGDVLSTRTPVQGLVDRDGDGLDDRILNIVPKDDISHSSEIKIDTVRGIAYLNGGASGVEAVCMIESDCSESVVKVTANDIRLGNPIVLATDRESCGQDELEFFLNQDAMVTIKIDGQVITVDNQLINNIPYSAGKHRIPIKETMLSPLNKVHHFEIRTVRGLNTWTTTGKIINDQVFWTSFPLGHTMIKGVSIVDGHLTILSEDIKIPGRGLSLDLTRSYNNAGFPDNDDEFSKEEPLGPGWTHSYHIRLRHDPECNRFVVQGGEGTGIGFVRIDDSSQFAPLPGSGYHSTLRQTGPTEFDFFTKGHVRYYFKQILPGDVYHLSFIEEPNGNKIALEYRTDGDPATLDQVTDSSGRSLLFEYQEKAGRKRIVKVTGRSLSGGDLLGLEILYEYDSEGNLTKATRKSPDPTQNFNDERVEFYTYTSGQSDLRLNHNLLSYTDPNGNKTDYVYHDPNASLSGIQNTRYQAHEIIKEIREPEGVVTTFSYNFTAKTRIVTGPRRSVPATIYTLNDHGATILIEEPLGKTTRIEWCTDTLLPACGGVLDVLMVSKTDAEGRKTEYEYLDGRGNLTREVVRFSGNKAPVTSADGSTMVTEVSTQYEYDPTFNKVVSKIDAEGNRTEFLIDAAYSGKPTFCPDPTPNRNTGMLLGVQDAEGNVTCYAYRLNSDLMIVTDPRGFQTTYFEYDLHGNPTKVRDSVGNITTNRFDDRSRLIETHDTFTHHILYTYDGLDRRISERRLDDQPGGDQQTAQETTYRYRPNGELLEMTDGLGQTTRYLYDALNRNTEKGEEGVRQADGTTTVLRTVFAYDEAGNVVKETDPRGIVRQHTYDELNRRTRSEINGKIIFSATYDRVDNKLTEADLHGHLTTFIHDGLYRVVERRLPFPNAIVKVAYDRIGNKVRETDANGQPTTFLYDKVYRLIRKTDADGNAISFAYDRAGNKTREENVSSGLVTEWTNPDYDGLNRPQIMRQIVPLGGPNLSQAVYEIRYEYQDSDNAVVITNPRGIKIRTDKDGLDRLFQTIVDVGGLNLTTTYAYDGNGNLASIKDPERGDVDVSHEYDGLNRKIRSTYVATPSDTRPHARVDGTSSVTEEFVYDGNNNLIQYKDKRGVLFTNSYDPLDRVLTKSVRETISRGGVELVLTEYQYEDQPGPDGLYRVIEFDANRNETVKKYDSLHRLTVVDDSDPAGLITFEYDGVNRLAEVDKKGHRTEFDFDPINRLTETREFDGSGALKTTLRIEYLDQDNRKRETDRRGMTTTSQFDGLQRLVQLKRSGLDMSAHYGVEEVLLETYEYDGNNNKIAFIDGKGNRTEFTYDNADRQVTIAEGAGSPVVAKTTMTYDQAGNLLTIKDGRNHGGAFDVKYEYDARYRKVAETSGEQETTRFVYDASNNLIEKSEPKGSAFRTLYRYDELNRLLEVDETPRRSAETAAGVTRFSYDPNRNKISQEDANENLVTYRYDGLNRLTDTFQHTVAGGDEETAFHWQYGYDLNGNQNLIIDAKGQRVEIEHDYLDRVVEKRHKNHHPADAALDFQMQRIEFIYDGNGNVTSITEVKKRGGVEATERTTQTFDPLDRLKSHTRTDHDGTSKQVSYDYDVQGNRTGITDPDGLVTTYTFDARNRLATVTTEKGLTKYTWWEDGLLKKIEYPNNTVVDRSQPQDYDRADRLLHLVNRHADPSKPTFSEFTYTYDDNGNRLTQIERQQDIRNGLPETTTYTYDNLNRLDRVTYGRPTQTPVTIRYAYDAVGNRLTEAGADLDSAEPFSRRYAYNRVNALIRIEEINPTTGQPIPDSAILFEYDDNLNQTAKVQGGVRTEYRYGIRDEMLQATERTGTVGAFDYNHDRMRVKRISGGTGRETRYFYDEDSVLVEYDGGAATRPVVHKYDYGYELLSMTQVEPDNGSREHQFYLTDVLMSTVNLTTDVDPDTGLAASSHSYSYDAWGKVRSQVGASENPRQYTGHYRDLDLTSQGIILGGTGLHYFGVRYYDDETSRFLAQDPYLGQQDAPLSLHRYLYAYANPLRYVDLTGYEASDAEERHLDLSGYHFKPGQTTSDVMVEHFGRSAVYSRVHNGVLQIRTHPFDDVALSISCKGKKNLCNQTETPNTRTIQEDEKTIQENDYELVKKKFKELRIEVTTLNMETNTRNLINMSTNSAIFEDWLLDNWKEFRQSPVRYYDDAATSAHTLLDHAALNYIQKGEIWKAFPIVMLERQVPANSFEAAVKLIEALIGLEGVPLGLGTKSVIAFGSNFVKDLYDQADNIERINDLNFKRAAAIGSLALTSEVVTAGIKSTLKSAEKNTRYLLLDEDLQLFVRHFSTQITKKTIKDIYGYKVKKQFEK